jgi:methylmalonyl-CoA epimerase
VFGKVHHIGIAVGDRDQAVADYCRTLGIGDAETCDLPEENVCVGSFSVGETLIEFVQPMEAGSGLSRFLEKRGEGLHHICLEVEDISEALSQLRVNGVRLIDEEPRQGAEGLVAFVHPKAMHGVLLELIQVQE